MADAFDVAIADLRHKGETWQAAVATCDHVRAAGTDSAAAGHVIAESLRVGGVRALSVAETQALQDLRDSTRAMALADATEVAARQALVTAEREYQRQELAWATAALARFGSRWVQSRVEGRRG